MKKKLDAIKKKLVAGCSGCLGLFVVMVILANYGRNLEAAEDYPALIQAMEVGDVAVVEQWYEKHGRADRWPEDSYERYWYWRLQQAHQVGDLEGGEWAMDRLVDREFGDYEDAEDLLLSLLQKEEERIRRERCPTCDATGKVRRVVACDGGTLATCYYGKSATRVYSAKGYSHYYCEDCHNDLRARNGGSGIFSVSYLRSTATCKDCKGTGKRR